MAVIQESQPRAYGKAGCEMDLSMPPHAGPLAPHAAPWIDYFVRTDALPCVFYGPPALHLQLSAVPKSSLPHDASPCNQSHAQSTSTVLCVVGYYSMCCACVYSSHGKSGH